MLLKGRFWAGRSLQSLSISLMCSHYLGRPRREKWHNRLESQVTTLWYEAPDLVVGDCASAASVELFQSPLCPVGKAARLSRSTTEPLPETEQVASSGRVYSGLCGLVLLNSYVIGQSTYQRFTTPTRRISPQRHERCVTCLPRATLCLISHTIEQALE